MTTGKDVSIHTKIIVSIDWLDPPKDEIEKLERIEAQQAVNKVADLLAQDITDTIFADLVKQGALKPKVDKKVTITNDQGIII